MGEQIQRAFPNARVVKSLNTMNCDVMVRPDLVPGEHVVFVAGEDAEAKATVTAMLGEFGWPAECASISVASRRLGPPRCILPIWIRLYGAVGGHHNFNIQVNQG